MMQRKVAKKLRRLNKWVRRRLGLGVHRYSPRQGVLDNAYHEAIRPEVLALTPKGSRRVLEIGCGAGSFGAALHARDGAEVWGIELVPDVAARAEARLFRVLCGPVEEQLKAVPDGAFDLVVCNDVLEHLVGPIAVLAALLSKLSPGGVVVASLPNVRFYDALLEILVKKDFPYASEGIFDRTHLHFYTCSSMHQLFNAAGYLVTHQQGINPTSRLSFLLWNALTLGSLADTRWLQYVVLARPASSGRNGVDGEGTAAYPARIETPL